MGGSSCTAAVAREGRANARLRKKPKQQQQQQLADGEEKGGNPLDPRFSDYDPKQGTYVFTRFRHRTLDLDMESPVGAMHHTNKIFKEGFRLRNLANIISVKIVSSDYGYPFNIYGTVIARDSLDRECVYIFQRGEDNCQFISSKNDSLILTGPKRGLMISDSIVFEIDLRVKDVNGRKVEDERLTKGLMVIDGIFRLSFAPKYKIETEVLVSMHSQLDLNYTFVRNAVEGTVEIRILQGPVDFHGKIVALTTSFPCDIILHDSKSSGMLTAGDSGIMQMAHRVVSVSVDEMLLLTVAATTGGVCTIELTPKRNSYEEEEITCGNYQMLMKVTWSIVCF